MSASAVGSTAADKIRAALTLGPAWSGCAAFPGEYTDDGQFVAQHIGRLGQDINEIKMVWFGDYGWITLCGSAIDAIKEAVASNSRAAPTAAMADTTWLVFRATLTPHQVTECFKENSLKKKKRAD